MPHDLAELARETPPGMAGICGTGPRGKTCRECAFWGGNRIEMTAKQLENVVKKLANVELVQAGSMVLVPWHIRRRYDEAGPVRQACMKYRQIRRAQKDGEAHSRRVPHATPACSMFVEYGDPQPIARPLKEGGPGTTEG